MGGFSGKGGGQFMPSPVTGAPRGLGLQTGGGGGGPGVMSTMPNPLPPTAIGGAAGGNGMAYAGGSNTFDEAGGGNGYGNQPRALGPPVNPGASPITNAGPSVDPQVMGDMLKRWDATGQLGAQQGVPDRGMGWQQPGSGASMPPAGGPPVGVPGMAPGNFGPPGQSGNSQDAIAQAMATGNQSGLTGQGSQATNSDINSAFYNQGVASPYYQANQVKLNRQGPAYQKGGMFYNPAIDG